MLVRVEHAARGPEPFEEVLREGVADAREALHEELLALVEREDLRLVPQPEVRDLGPTPFVEREERLARLLLVGGEDERDLVPDGEREERAPERARVLEFRHLREVALHEDDRDGIRFAQALELLE